MSRRHRIAPIVIDEIERIVSWYLRTAYGRWEGPGVLPFYGDVARVGHFGVDLTALAARDPAAMFRLLITMASYQSRRDVDIMRIQRAMSHRNAVAMTSVRRLRVLVEESRCSLLRDADEFDRSCDVRRDLTRGVTTCDAHPRTPCHVKEATAAIGRMGDLGKLPTSAWLHLGPAGLHRWFVEACLVENDPHRRAIHLVERVSGIYRIGTKLASMFVTGISVRELGHGAPWSPEIDGSRIVVVDANVARAIRMWRRNRGAQTYDALATWLVLAADQIDLTALHCDLPRSSPRFIQQAIYLFRSRSNRKAHGDRCATTPCADCPSTICPFHAEPRTTVPTRLTTGAEAADPPARRRRRTRSRQTPSRG